MNHWYAGCIPDKLAVSLALAVLVSGCSTLGSGEPTQSELISDRLDSYVVEDGTVRHDVTDANVARLWQEYNIMRRSGNLKAAKQKLEQAISITPSDAALWSGAAELELEEKSHLRAENYAAKSNVLAADSNRPLRFRNWVIIERARQGRGDLLGAREAQIESSRLQ